MKKITRSSQVAIDIGVGGRFHSDYMADAFLKMGYETKLTTSYPRNRFPLLPRQLIRSFLLPELCYRTLRKLGYERLGEQVKMRLFGKMLSLTGPLATHATKSFSFVWSSFALERFRNDKVTHKVLVRDSTHILHQCSVLSEEFGKLGMEYSPDVVCVNRELEEYQLADTVLVLSQYAKKTFQERGIPEAKIEVIPLGVNTSVFKPEKREKISGPVRAIYFGTLSVRKGIHYLLEATKEICPTKLKLTLVGPVEPTFQPILNRYSHFDYYPAMSHPRLARFAAEHDLYLFPTLEDGFPNTLIQAMAAGLVPITTKECGPAEYLTAGEDAFFVPRQNAEVLKETILEAIADPARLLRMRAKAIFLSQRLTWKRYEDELAGLIDRKIRGEISSTLDQEEKALSFRGGATLDAR